MKLHLWHRSDQHERLVGSATTGEAEVVAEGLASGPAVPGRDAECERSSSVSWTNTPRRRPAPNDMGAARDDGAGPGWAASSIVVTGADETVLNSTGTSVAKRGPKHVVAVGPAAGAVAVQRVGHADAGGGWG